VNQRSQTKITNQETSSGMKRRMNSENTTHIVQKDMRGEILTTLGEKPKSSQAFTQVPHQSVKNTHGSSVPISIPNTLRDEGCYYERNKCQSRSMNTLQSKPAIHPRFFLRRKASHDLFECIETHKGFSEDRARSIFVQILSAVHYLHSNGIAHRDIKDENVVIDSSFKVRYYDVLHTRQ
jgi:serine/threonine protein kinase